MLYYLCVTQVDSIGPGPFAILNSKRFDQPVGPHLLDQSDQNDGDDVSDSQEATEEEGEGKQKAEGKENKKQKKKLPKVKASPTRKRFPNFVACNQPNKPGSTSKCCSKHQRRNERMQFMAHRSGQSEAFNIVANDED